MFKRFWWVFLVMAVATPTLGLFISATITYVMPKKFESTATIQFRGNWEKGIDPGAPGYQILQDHIQAMKSDEVLLKVAGNLELPNKWGYPTAEILQKMRDAIRIEQRRGTELIDIIVRHTNKEETRDIAAELVRAYKMKLDEERWNETEKYLIQMRSLIRKQQGVVNHLQNLASSDDQNDELRRNYEAARDELEAMKLRVGTALASTPNIEPMVPSKMIVHEDPTISQRPVSPNVTMNLLIGVFGGLLLSPLLSLPLIWLLNRLVRKPPQVPSPA